MAFAPRHTKTVAYKTLVRPKVEYAAPIWHPYHETQIGQVEKVQRTAARWSCRRWRNTSSVGDMLDELEWPSLETRREQSSLTFFYSGLDKDKYLTPVSNLRRTRAAHESQHTRYLEKIFSPRTIPTWKSLPSSVVLSKPRLRFRLRAFMVLPMVPLVYQYRSKFYNGTKWYQWYHWPRPLVDNTVWAKLPTLESHMIQYGVLNF